MCFAISNRIIEEPMIIVVEYVHKTYNCINSRFYKHVFVQHMHILSLKMMCSKYFRFKKIVFCVFFG